MKLILLGAPGAGKGTICNILQDKLNLEHISTGNLFREAIKKEDELSWKIKNILNSGELVDDSITNEIAKNAILAAQSNHKGFMLDGYPRTREQAEFLNKIVEIDKVIYLKISNDELINRIVNRRICPNCEAIYNLKLAPQPKVAELCDNCHITLVQRKDDNLETAQKRIDKYEKETEPLINYYKQKGILVEIDAAKSIEEIYQSILTIGNSNND